MYWGDAFPTLLFLKKKYDPDGFFRFEQEFRLIPTWNHSIGSGFALYRHDDLGVIGRQGRARSSPRR
jgi:hypothetical protein